MWLISFLIIHYQMNLEYVQIQSNQIQILKFKFDIFCQIPNYFEFVQSPFTSQFKSFN